MLHVTRCPCNVTYYLYAQTPCVIQQLKYVTAQSFSVHHWTGRTARFKQVHYSCTQGIHSVVCCFSHTPTWAANLPVTQNSNLNQETGFELYISLYQVNGLMFKRFTINHIQYTSNIESKNVIPHCHIREGALFHGLGKGRVCDMLGNITTFNLKYDSCKFSLIPSIAEASPPSFFPSFLSSANMWSAMTMVASLPSPIRVRSRFYDLTAKRCYYHWLCAGVEPGGPGS